MVTAGRMRAASVAATVAALAISVAGTPAQTAIARAFFVVTILAGLVAGAGLRGPRTQLAVALAALVLVIGQVIPGGRPVTEPPSPDWRAVLETTSDRAEVRMRLDASAWRDALGRASAAWAYVCAEGIGSREHALTLHVQTDQAQMAVPVGAPNAIGARPRPEQGGMYRVPVRLDSLHEASVATLSVTLAGTSPTPVRLCGTHSIRPSWGEPTSALVRGGIATAPGPKGPGRWVIELRLVGANDRLLLAWY